MMVVVAIVGILAMVAIPFSMGRIIKEQVMVAIPLADIAKEVIAASWKDKKLLPSNNNESELPPPNKIVNNFVQSVEINNGVINMTFGNKSHINLRGKVLSFRLANIEDAQIVPVTWVCGNAKFPDQMNIKGENKTTIPEDYLPYL